VITLDVFNAIERRRSVRKFKSQPILVNHLRKILEAGRLAPSAGNHQPWRFIVVRNSALKISLAEAARQQHFIANASVIIVALGDASLSSRWFAKDTMIALEHMVLTATELGYGTCWIGAFTEIDVRTLLAIPETMTVVALLPIGIPDESPSPKPRKAFDAIYFEDQYGNPLTLN
jgi:nitroreductase